MREHVSSTIGGAMAAKLGPQLTDSEFRVLMVMADCPAGDRFAADLETFVQSGMAEKDAKRAISTLAMQREFINDLAETQFFVFENYRVEWRFYQ